MADLLVPLGAITLVMGGILLFAILKRRRLEAMLADRDRQLSATNAELEDVRKRAEAAVRDVHEMVDKQRAGLASQVEQARLYYEAESKKIAQDLHTALVAARGELDAVSQYRALLAEEGEASRMLAEAVTEAQRLRATANALLEGARASASEEPIRARQEAKDIRAQADALLDRATREAGRLVDEGREKALAIGGDAYRALEDKEQLERALKAIKDIIEGYGDRYIIPTRSLLDDLAADFGHTEAGQCLAEAREQTKRLVEESQAAACDYAEENRRTTAIRFVLAAFNGHVDAILSRVKQDNHGTLEEEIRNEFALVNLHGTAFRNARIQQAYLDNRLLELKWAVIAQELRLREREEQLRIKEQMREEERARREYERAIEEATKEEHVIAKALEKARLEVAMASANERAALEQRIVQLTGKLSEAEAKNQRALSMAQQTRKGTIYVISNVGSFGEDTFKIGMTRRLEPSDRIKELGDASVPFEFDVHAMISSDNAPALEAQLHRELQDSRINLVNLRKEFFRVPLDRLRKVVVESGHEVSFTMLAEAREFRETQALLKMSLAERAKYLEG